MEETKHDRFKRVAARRANDLLEGIRILGNCSNKANYDYDTQEVDKIFSELDKALKSCRSRFESQYQHRIRL